MLANVIQGQQQADANAAAEEGEPFLGSGRLGMCQWVGPVPSAAYLQIPILAVENWGKCLLSVATLSHRGASRNLKNIHSRIVQV